MLNLSNLRPEEGFYFRSFEAKEFQIQSKEIQCYSFHCTVVCLLRLFLFFVVVWVFPLSFNLLVCSFVNWMVSLVPCLILIASLLHSESLTKCTFLVIRTCAPEAHAFITRPA